MDPEAPFAILPGDDHHDDNDDLMTMMFMMIMMITFITIITMPIDMKLPSDNCWHDDDDDDGNVVVEDIDDDSGDDDNVMTKTYYRLPQNLHPCAIGPRFS